MMTPKLDLSGAAPQVPGEFGNFQLTDNGQTRQLQGSAQIRHQADIPAYHSAYDQKYVPEKHHDVWHGGANDGDSSAHKRHQQQPQRQQPAEATLTGTATVPGSNTPEGYRPSETISTTLSMSDYREGKHFGEVLNIPHEKGKSNYYNGLANAHFKDGHLYGVPVHMVNGQMTSHLDHEIDIRLRQKK